MSDTDSATIYEELGVTPVINARGNQTVLGGSMFAPAVQAAMDAANRYFVDMGALQERGGELIAELVGCEAALVTPGCAAALALGTAACVAGDDEEKMARLPDTAGMKRNVLIQAGQRYHYERATTIVGTRLVEVGDANGTSAAQLAAAMDDETAVVLVPAHLDGHGGTLPLTEVVAIAHEHDVPVLVDAASQIYPVERLRSWTAMGADLVGFGAKYFGGGNSAGLLCGRKDLVASAATQSFIGFELGPARGRVFGRPLKLDRQEITGTVVAVREWVTMDHEVRIQQVQRRLDALVSDLGTVAAAQTSVHVGARFGAPALCIQIDPASGHTGASVRAALAAGNPSIVVGGADDELDLNLGTIADGDVAVIAARLREILST